MKYFNFRQLIKRFSRDFVVITENKGYYNDRGIYVHGTPTETTLHGAIIGYSENKQYRSEGNITQMDKALHMTTPIDNALMGATVIFDGDKYRIETQKGKGNADFTGVYSYTLKYVSAFNGKEGGADD